MTLLNIPKSLRSRKDMIAFLRDHFRYDTMNSWNRSTSYANKIKIRNFALTHEQADACYDLMMLEDAGAVSGFSEVLDDFAVKHEHRWQIGTNGRSSGYLVLYQGGTHPGGQHFSLPGRGLDESDAFDSWAIDNLRARVALVLDFDRTCEAACQAFLDYAVSHKVVERRVTVVRKVKVAVPKSEAADGRGGDQ
mgnify:CR=1 FL=1